MTGRHNKTFDRRKRLPGKKRTRCNKLGYTFFILAIFCCLFLHPPKGAALTPEELEHYSGAKYEPLQGCYLGAYIDQAYWLHGDPGQFNEVVGKEHASFFRYVGYGQPFPEEWVAELAATGAVPQIAWEPNAGLEQVQDDDYLRTFARQAGASGAPIFLRFASEVNGNWTSYTGNPQEYIEKWRLVYRVMQEEAPNVAMVWAVFTHPQRTITTYYPGDDYVDWVGVNVYSVIYENADPRRPSAERDPLALLSYVYDLFSDRKPIHISEWAVVNYTVADNQHYDAFAAAKIRRMYEGIIEEMPRIKAVYYFDANIAKTAPPDRRIRDYSVSKKEETLAAYREVIAPDHFLSLIRDNVNLETRVNGSKLTFEDLPILDGDELYVSARDLAKTLGLQLEWRGAGEVLFGNWILTIGEERAQQLNADGEVTTITQTELAPVLFQERTFLPLLNLSAHLGFQVQITD